MEVRLEGATYPGRGRGNEVNIRVAEGLRIRSFFSEMHLPREQQSQELRLADVCALDDRRSWHSGIDELQYGLVTRHFRRKSFVCLESSKWSQIKYPNTLAINHRSE